MHPIIILDGPDGTGKTTIAEWLKKKHGYRVIKLTYKYDWHKKRMHVYMTAALNLALRLSRDHPVIIDRFWASEGAYATAYRGGSPWPLMWRFLEREVLRHGIYTVWCLPRDKQHYLKHWEQIRKVRPGHEWKTDRERTNGILGMERVYDEYWRITNIRPATRVEYLGGRDMDVRSATYDFTMWPDPRLWHDYLDNIHRFARDLRVDHAFDGVRLTGNIQDPTLIFVGESSNFKGRKEVPPFYEYANSSLYLTSCIDIPDAREDRLAYANLFYPGTFDPDGDVERWLDSKAAEGTKIVPLGAKVASRLYKRGIETQVGIHHPAYYNRFNREQGKVDIMNVLLEHKVI